MAGYTLEQSKTIIDNAGGCVIFAEKLNHIQDKFLYRQVIEYWYKKGIPSKWQLNHSRYFNRLLNKKT